MLCTLKWKWKHAFISQMCEIDFVTETVGLKQSDSRWKACDVRKMLDCRDRERIGQRWMKQAREMCISICLHFVRLSVSISLCLSLSGLIHCPWVLLRSLILMEFREGVREGGRKEQEQGFIAVTLSSSGMLSVSIAYCSASARPPTHTQLKHILVKHTCT